MKEYTTTQAAPLLGVAPNTVTHYVRDGLIKAEKVGRDYMITEEDLNAFLANRRKRGRPVRNR